MTTSRKPKTKLKELTLSELLALNDSMIRRLELFNKYTQLSAATEDMKEHYAIGFEIRRRIDFK